MPIRRWFTAVAALTLGSTLTLTPSPAPAETRTAAAPALKVRTVAKGLRLPWDVQSIGRGRLLVTERDRARLSLIEDGRRRTVRLRGGRKIWVGGETGLLSLQVSPAFAQDRRIWTCHGWRSGDRRDVRVTLWQLNRSLRRAKIVRHVVTGMPVTTGRHGGCRLLLDASSSALYVGTGDAADEANPRDLTSLGGKVLRVDRWTGEPIADNPWANAESVRQRLVYNYGHRNIQGLAQRPSDGAVVSVEHGSYRDDEVNAVLSGADYGWQPGPGYDESAPMTDQGLPGRQQEAIWSSGTPTIATSGAAWVNGSRWGAYDGTLAVAALGGERMVFLGIDDSLALTSSRTPASLRTYGRLRSVTALPGGALLVTTSNGTRDRILKVTPR